MLRAPAALAHGFTNPVAVETPRCLGTKWVGRSCKTCRNKSPSNRLPRTFGKFSEKIQSNHIVYVKNMRTIFGDLMLYWGYCREIIGVFDGIQ